MKKRILAAFMAVVMMFSFAGCAAGGTTAGESTTHKITDLLGREVNVPNEIDKIAAIAGPTYEMVFMLGSADQVVMVKSGHTDSYPLANLTNPKLIDMAGIAANPSSTVNIEDYLAQEIDLVVYYDNEIELKKFDAVDMAAIVATKNTGLMDTLEQAQTQTIDEFVDTLTTPLRILSDAIDTEEAHSEYDAWAKYCDEKLKMVYERTKDIPESERPTVYWGNTWGEEIRASYSLKNRWYEVYLAGGNLLGPEENSNFPEVTAEQLYTWDPDIILVDNHGDEPELVMKSMYKENSKWSTLKAVQNRELHRIPSGVFFLDKGSTTTLLVMWMATFMHPELFSDIDMIEEIKYYYSEFYEFELTDDQARMVIEGWVEE
ncbi:MAG: ABC transporter substrate-binding protein [Oscillospiraceae bacterium]|nr:ABC transporter substrate-binding protein [Oscillospiraceae bacterium]